VAIQNPALFLASKIMENFSEMLAKVTIEGLPSTLGYPNYMILAIPSGVT